MSESRRRQKTPRAAGQDCSDAGRAERRRASTELRTSRAIPSPEAVTEHLSQPETILPTQYFTTVREQVVQQTGECQLLLAVLEDAVRCYQKYAGITWGPGRRLFREAEHWFMRTDQDALAPEKGGGFSFGQGVFSNCQLIDPEIPEFCPGTRCSGIRGRGGRARPRRVPPRNPPPRSAQRVGAPRRAPSLLARLIPQRTRASA